MPFFKRSIVLNRYLPAPIFNLIHHLGEKRLFRLKKEKMGKSAMKRNQNDRRNRGIEEGITRAIFLHGRGFDSSTLFAPIDTSPDYTYTTRIEKEDFNAKKADYNCG